MALDMDMDVAWCLTCSKRTRDARNPYCSDACRDQETQFAVSSQRSLSITSSIPAPFILPAPVAAIPRATSPAKKAGGPSRPPVTPLLPGPASVNALASTGRVPPRDRRAFSFPASQALATAPPIKIIKNREARQSQSILPPFARKPMGFSLSSVTSPQPGKDMDGNLRPPTMRQSKSTGGANTPLDPESVFCSTSESEDEHEIGPSPLRLMSKPTPDTSVLPSSASMSRKSSKSQRASLPVPPQQSQSLYTRKTSQSPVAALVASSASSRSREDIISWAKAVGLRPGENGETTDEDEDRGRSRTRRSEGLHMSSHPESDGAEEPDLAAAGTTPKGRIGTALAGLGLPGLGIVKALTSSISPPPHPQSADPLRTVPSKAKVSHVAVVTTAGGITIPSINPSDSDTAPHFGGATPTLSTISFSEVVDPSVGDQPEHVEIVTTDDAFSTSSFARRPTEPKILRQTSARKAPLPLRPITTTATAIWNLSTYLRSFAPFSIASVIAPYAPIAADKAAASSASSTPVAVEEETELHVPPSTSPLPASRTNGPESPAQQMVRSLPMDIVIPPNASGIITNEERVREREVREWLDRSSSRHRSSSRRRRDSSPKQNACSVFVSRGSSSSSHGPRHVRKPSYDGDASDEEDEDEPRRGRSRRVSKVVAKEDVPSLGGRRLSEGVVEVLGERSQSRSSGRGRRRALRV